ncbi:MAG: hypothetical protein AB8B97_18520 [Granulosicoccus sp.]
MQIVHRISFTADEQLVARFKSHGVDINIGDNMRKVKESDKAWPLFKEVVKERGRFGIVTTEFTKGEVKSASLVEMATSRHQGYPQPEGDFGYLDQVYDTMQYCKSCGLGPLPQIDSFRFRGEPKWGKNEVLQLNWVYDELFVTPQLYEQVFHPLGIENWQVIHHKRDVHLETVVQLRIPEVDVSFDMPEGFATETCTVCRKNKYQPWVRGFLPSLTAPVDLDIFKPSTIFGSGGKSFRSILISSDLCSTLIERGARGLLMKPVKEFHNP